MRYFRSLCYFVMGLLISTWAVFSYAETVPATSNAVSTLTAAGIGQYSGYGLSDSTFSGYCVKALAANGGYPKGSCPDLDPKTQPNREGYCGRYFANSYCSNSVAVYSETCPANYAMVGGVCKNNVVVYTCPTGQNWTLSGQTCTRPDCVAPKVRNSSTGLCESPCLSKKDQYSSGYVKVVKNTAPPTGNFCIEGCQVNRVLSVMDEVLLSKGYDWFSIGQTFTGESCTSSDSAANPTEPVAPAKPPKVPPCASGEGVMTSSSGAVKCVPEGIPDANKPTVRKEKKTETFPDNTTKTTETTTTTDPNTSATHTSTTSTATAKSDGTSGQAGTAGTTTSTGGTSTSTGGGGSGSGEDGGECDPTLQMCDQPSTEDIYKKKEKTFEGVLGKFSNDMKETPIGKALEDSLNITVPSSGACPNLSAEIPYLNTTIDLAPYICNPTAIEYLELMGTVLKIMVGYIALTWVFL